MSSDWFISDVSYTEIWYSILLQNCIYICYDPHLYIKIGILKHGTLETKCEWVTFVESAWGKCDKTKYLCVCVRVCVCVCVYGYVCVCVCVCLCALSD